MGIKYIPKAIFFDANTLVRENSSRKDLPNEYRHARLFLISYSHSKDTYNTYRREVERFCQWVWYVKESHVMAVDRHVMQEYIAFFQSPPSSWVAPQNYPRFLYNGSDEEANPSWRPFVVKPGKQRQVSQAGMKSMLACLSTFFSFLVHEGEIQQNPVARLAQKRQLCQTHQQKRIKRRFSHIQWDYVIRIATLMADDNPKYERQLYLLSMFYLLGVRISEVSQTATSYKAMNAFHQDKRQRWWFEAHGKGNKVRDVAVPDAMLTSLSRYRLSIGLSALPDPADSSPLVPKHKGMGGLSARQVRFLLSEMFQHAIDALIRDGHTLDANNMRNATVHWLRHTAISVDVQDRPSEHVRDDVGHENIATTSLYIDVLDESRHESARLKPLIPCIEETP